MNLSSDEDDFDEGVISSGATQSEKFERKNCVTEITPCAAKARASLFRHDSSDESSCYDGLDWQDAEDENSEVGGLDRKRPSKVVEIDLNAPVAVDSSPPNRKRKRKRRMNVLSNRFLPSEITEFLKHLSQAHLLCLTSALVSASKLCTDPDAVAIIASLVPGRFNVLTSRPAVDSLRDLTTWLFPFLNEASNARNRRLWRNRSQGAPSVRHRTTKIAKMLTRTLHNERSTSPLISYARYLAAQYDDDPQLFDASQDESISLPDQKAFFSLALAHSFQWRARLVQILEPVRPVLDVDHPMLLSCVDLFQRQSSANKQKKTVESIEVTNTDFTGMAWIEVLCTDPSAKTGFRWIPVDPVRKRFDLPDEISKHFQGPIAYVVAVEHNPQSGCFRVCDVTPRYTNSWIAVLKHRGIFVGKKKSVDETKTWWYQSLQLINHGQRLQRMKTGDDATVIDDLPQKAIEAEDYELENAEREELSKRVEYESIPTNIAAFQTHPVYVIPSVLGKTEVLAPDASKRICGVFKGQMVYKRSDVSEALTPQRWLLKGRKVKPTALGKPIKTVKARKKPLSKSFKALKSYGVGSDNDGSEQQRIRDIEAGSNPLSDGMEQLYAEWQTEPWSPTPVEPHEKIPVNEYGNIELGLLNPGLVHIDQPGLAAVAKKLGIPYAPCLVGFEGHGGNRAPSIRGIVVHNHNESIIREAAVEWQNHEAEVNDAKRRKTILSRWKRLMVGLLTKERLDREYGAENETM